MKRTKTFVTKFLSVLAVGAIVLSSCTKDLEDRLDKVEETLNVVVKDVASLKDELTKMQNEPKASVDAVMDATTGKVTLTFKNPDKTIVFDGKNDGNDKAVVTVEENKPGAGFTTVTVDGKAFTYPTTIEIPNNVTSISLTNANKTLTVFEGAKFRLNYKFNTNKGESVDALIKAANLTVVQGKTRAAESALSVAPFTVTGVERIGTTNEYELTFTASSIVAVTSPAGAYNVKIQLNNADKTLSSEFVEVTLAAIPTITSITHGVTAFEATPASLAGEVIVNEMDGAYTDVTSKVNFSVFNNNTVNFSVDAIENLEVKVYEYTTAYNGTAYFNLSSTTPIVNEPFNTWVSTAGNGVKEVAIASIEKNIDGKSFNLVFDATAAAKTITGYNSKTFFVAINGKTVSTNGSYFRAAGTYQVTKRLGITMPAQTPKYAAETSTSVLTFKQNYTTKKYFDLTGAASFGGAITAKVYDKEGVEVTDGIKLVTGKLDAFEYLEYTVTMDQPKFKAGEYKVVVSVTENTKVYEFVQTVTVQRPTSGVKVITPDAADKGYAVTGNAASFDSYLAAVDHTIATKEIELKKVFASNITVPTGGAAVVDGINYKVFYALYTLAADGKTKNYVQGAPVFASVAFNDNLVTKFTVVETPTVANNIKFDQIYKVDAFVVYASGFKDEINTDFTVVYNTRPITGFLSTSGESGVYSKVLARTMTYGDDATKAISVAYVKDGVKPFFFGNDAKVAAIVTDEVAPVKDKYNYLIDATVGIAYAVDSITVTDENKTLFTPADGQTVAVGDKLSFISTGGADAALLTFAEVRDASKATLKFAANTKVKALTAPVKQTVKVGVTDIWGITRMFTIEVTINAATK